MDHVRLIIQVNLFLKIGVNYLNPLITYMYVIHIAKTVSDVIREMAH